MANFLTGTVLGGVAAVVTLGAASVLLPSRPEAVIAAPVVAPEAPAEVAAEVATAPKAAVEPELPKESLLDPAPEVPAKVPAAPVDPVPEPVAEPVPDPMVEKPVTEGGAKTLTPPVAGAVKLPKSDGALAGDVATVAPPVAAEPADKLAAVDAVAPEASTQEAAAPEAVAPDAVAPEAPADAAIPPLVKYAAAFDNLDGKPLFAVILRDTGGADVDRAALAALTFPVTFAIDPEAANAAEAMSIYRAAGHEVVMLAAGLPAGATAQDMEQSFQTYEAILPETVAVMGLAKGGFQDSPSLAKLIVPVVAAQGRGLITFDRGLNAAAQGAQREGVPHGEVLRQVDGGGESVPVIRRYLDRAVFNAAQDGGAIVMGETAPDTIAALLEWSVEGRASDVALAPVSALLKVE